jgi:hypothetical protein
MIPSALPSAAPSNMTLAPSSSPLVPMTMNSPAPAASPAPASSTSFDHPAGNAQPPLKPIPDSNDSNSLIPTAPPRLLDPAARTTSMPIMRPGLYVPVSHAQAITTGAVQPAAATADADEWHSAR